MSPVPEIFHLLIRGAGMYLPVVGVCLVSGYIQKVANFDSDFLGYILVLIAAWNSSQTCKAGGDTAFWLGRPFRTPVLGIYLVTVLFLSVCAYLAGAGIWWIVNGLNPDLVFWYSMEKVPPLLFTGLLGLCLFVVTTSGSGLFKMVLWIAGLVIGGMALLSKISEKLYIEFSPCPLSRQLYSCFS
ncbi:MAG: hypothetical protein P1V20_19415 [Verrucomicrobiales bacterium]|nr:hypothetical protein [Verrucomicrobiales bacterium]